MPRSIVDALQSSLIVAGALFLLFFLGKGLFALVAGVAPEFPSSSSFTFSPPAFLALPARVVTWPFQVMWRVLSALVWRPRWWVALLEFAAFGKFFFVFVCKKREK